MGENCLGGTTATSSPESFRDHALLHLAVMAEKMFNIQRSATHNAAELQDFLKDLNDWEGDIKRKDDQLKKTTSKDSNKNGGMKNLPPVRGSVPSSNTAAAASSSSKGGSKKKEKMDLDKNNDKENGVGSGSGDARKMASGKSSTAASSSTDSSSFTTTNASLKKPSVPRDYRAWDKINVDAMLAELEIAEEDRVKKVEESSEEEDETSSSEEEEDE